MDLHNPVGYEDLADCSPEFFVSQVSEVLSCLGSRRRGPLLWSAGRASEMTGRRDPKLTSHVEKAVCRDGWISGGGCGEQDGDIPWRSGSRRVSGHQPTPEIVAPRYPRLQPEVDGPYLFIRKRLRMRKCTDDTTRFFADILLTPLEATRIRLVSDPKVSSDTLTGLLTYRHSTAGSARGMYPCPLKRETLRFPSLSP